MTALLAFISTLMSGLFINQVRKNRQLNRKIINLSAQLEQQSASLARLAKGAEAPAAEEPPAPLPGPAPARQFTPAAAWGNAFLLALALTLSQAAYSLVPGPAFGRDMGRLAVLLAALALCARPPRLALFQELSLCRLAGLILSGLVLWQGLVLALDPADRPGFFGFLPVLNLPNLAQAAAFWLPAAFFRRLTAPDRPPALSLLEGLLFFIWLNVVLARTIHHLAGVPYQFGALFGSTLFWLVCAGVWGGLGLWVWGRRPQANRPSPLQTTAQTSQKIEEPKRAPNW
jgi:hypothetical protein